MEHSRSYALHGGAKGSTVAVRAPLLHDLAAQREAERTTHVIEGGALILDLPEWARKPVIAPERKAVPLREPEPVKPQRAAPRDHTARKDVHGMPPRPGDAEA